MIANMTLGQRAISIWMLILLVLIAFVIYLDGGFNSEPLILFILLWVIDVALLLIILVRCLHAHNVFGLSEYTMISGILPSLTIKPGLYACSIIISKFTFEILLYIQLRHRSIGVLYMMIPFWTFLGLIGMYLFQNLVEFHKKF